MGGGNNGCGSGLITSNKLLKSPDRTGFALRTQAVLSGECDYHVLYMYICMLGGMCLASYDHSIKVIAHTRNILELMNLIPRLPTKSLGMRQGAGQ